MNEKRKLNKIFKDNVDQELRIHELNGQWFEF